ARSGHRRLRSRTDRFSYAGQPSRSTTADNCRPASTSARLRSAHRVRRHDRRNSHDFEGPVVYLEGKGMNTPVIIRGTLLLRRRANVPEPDATSIAPTTKICRCRIPRIARLMPLARHVHEFLRSATLASYP